MVETYERIGVSPGRGAYDAAVIAGEFVAQARAKVAKFFGSDDPSRVIFAANATDALNTVIAGLVRPGDHVVATRLDHNSVLRPIHHLAERGIITYDLAPFDGLGFVDPGAVAALIRPNTRAVVICYSSNVLGTIQPIAEIGRLCTERGVALVVDAAQGAGQTPIDMKSLGISALAFTGHKSLFGPMGIGGAYVAEGVTIRHTRAGGTGVKSAQRTHLDEYPYRLEYGTPNMPGIAGLNAGLKWIQARGMHAIHEHEMKLMTRLRDGLRAIDGVTLYCQDDLADHIAVLLFNINGLEAGDTGTMLDVDHNIACRTGLHCAPLVHEQIGTAAIHGGVRFGIGPFNTEAHIDHAIAAVKEIAGLRATA
jgi:cysteine desulfurase/selenocysteine lyase